jgi:hypothetical protein
MKPDRLRPVFIASIVLSWLVIGLNLYLMVTGNNDSSNGLNLGSDANITYYTVGNGDAGSKTNFVEQLFSNKAPERASPCQRIRNSQVVVTGDKIEILYPNAEWATFSDTNSMDPVLDNDTFALEYVPKSESELCVGDIASYIPTGYKGVVIHRVVEIGYDSQGWYAIFKGDNLSYRDPDKVRFSQIQRVVIGILY